jgi:GT2 family glycosyltransferase
MFKSSDTIYPPVSIIIVNYNGRKFLEECLNSVLLTRYPNFEIIFVDNGSTDGSVEYILRLAQNDSRIKLIQNSTNLGFAEGNNSGIRHARGEYIVLLNNDTVVDPNWIAELVKAMEKDQDVAVAQAKLLSYYNHRVIDSAGGIIDRWGFSIDRGMEEVDEGQYDNNQEIFFACFAASIVRKKVFREVGLLDTRFFAMFEDVDFCWRVRLRGYRAMLVPSAVVYHKRGGTVKTFENTPLFYLVNFHFYKNRLAMLIKNYGSRNLVKRLPVTLLLQALAFARNIFIKRDARLGLAVLKSYFWVILNLKYIMYRRRICQITRRVSDNEIENVMQKHPLTVKFVKRTPER